MSRIPLHELEAFARVVRAGSFKRAAEEMNVTVSAVSHRIRALELRLSGRLFDRRHARAVPTALGLMLAEDAVEAFTRLDRLAARALDSDSGGLVAIHATPTIAGLWLTPRLGRLLAAFPSADVRVTATVRPADPGIDPVDFSLRYGRGDWPGLHARPLMLEPVVPLAAPSLLARLGRPLRAEDLRSLPLIRSEVNLLGWEDFFRACNLPWAPATRVLGFDRSLMAIDAAARGLGVALDSAIMAAAHLADGRLTVPLKPPGGHLSYRAHFLAVPADRGPKQLAARVADWIVREAEASAAEVWAALA